MKFNILKYQRKQLKRALSILVLLLLGVVCSFAQDAINLVLTPSATSVGEGQTVQVDLVVELVDNPEIRGIEVHVDYDPAFLQLNSLVPMTIGVAELPTLQNVTSTAGEIDYTGANVNMLFLPTSNFILFRLEFTALQPTNATDISFAFDAPGNRETMATGGLTNEGNILDILAGTTNASIEIVDVANITGNVKLQSRTDHSATDIVLKLYEPGTETQVGGDYNVETDANGDFSIAGLPIGTFDVFIKKSNFLQNELRNITLQGGDNDALIFGTLLAGDAFNDNKINIMDFTILAEAFGSVEGGATYAEAADFTGDAKINLNDFTFLAENFGKLGANPGTPEP